MLGHQPNACCSLCTDRASQDARRGVAMVITRLLQTAEVKSALLASAGALGQVVSQLLVS